MRRIWSSSPAPFWSLAEPFGTDTRRKTGLRTCTCCPLSIIYQRCRHSDAITIFSAIRRFTSRLSSSTTSFRQTDGYRRSNADSSSVNNACHFNPPVLHRSCISERGCIYTDMTKKATCTTLLLNPVVIGWIMQFTVTRGGACDSAKGVYCCRHRCRMDGRRARAGDERCWMGCLA